MYAEGSPAEPEGSIIGEYLRNSTKKRGHKYFEKYSEMMTGENNEHI